MPASALVGESRLWSRLMRGGLVRGGLVLAVRPRVVETCNRGGDIFAPAL